MTRPPRGLFAALCCLLALATSASAECAWVLWGSDQTIRPNNTTAKAWGPLDAAETYADCLAKATKSVQVSVDLAKKEGLHYQIHEDKTSVSTSDDRLTFIRLVGYQCFPDTVDPRGPKGK